MSANSSSSQAKNSVEKADKKTSKTLSSSEKLGRLGLHKPMDFALHLPMRYEDETHTLSIREASSRAGLNVQIEGIVLHNEIQYRPRKQLIVSLEDESGQCVLRFLHFYGSQVKTLSAGTRLRVRGEMRYGFFGCEMVHPNCKVITKETPLPTTLTPVYPTCEGVSQAMLRKAILTQIKQVTWEDTLPAPLRQQYQLIPIEEAVQTLHFPPADVDMHALLEKYHPAWQRVKFDELLAQQLSMQRAQRHRRHLEGIALPHLGDITQKFLNSLPFQLTQAQNRVLNEIRTDLRQTHPMQRLLQGDVGSGKTIVAALCATQAIDNGYQAVLMAPTEILAEQHFRKIATWLAPLGVSTTWLTGSLKKKEKDIAQQHIAQGDAQLIIGTHAVIQDAVEFHKLGLVIIDEQHRFGVAQRLALKNKALAGTGGKTPHQLMMSATPIPRTLAMTYYADLEVSSIDELPPGRTPILTRVVDQTRRDEVIGRVHHAAQEGKQIYWVCPLIEESEALQLQTAQETYDLLQAALPDCRIGLIHGKLKPLEKQTVMEAFVQHHIQVLVATTVIEVGVDVPNASLMVIEHAERFGLSQLHQLRGRVGRGSAASVCLLMYQSPLGQIAKQRLSIMRETNDGFEIARQDLLLRGPGEFLGARQSGEALLRFADLEKDQDMAIQTQKLATQLLDESNPIVEIHLQRWMGEREAFLRV